MEEVKGSVAETEKEGIGFSGPLVSSSDVVDHKPVSVQGRVTGPARKSSNWTKEEDKILEAAVQRFNGKCWKKIAECFPGRTDVQCLHRWQKVLNPGLIKGPWTKEEDNLIIELVGKQGSNKKWSEIAKHLPGRIGKQCRERWHNHLNPAINKNPWSKEEELVLIKAHAVYGNKWAEIAKFLHGRTENAIKNHWNCSVKKKLDQYHHRFNHPGFVTPVLYSNKAEAGSRKPEVVKERLGKTFCLDHKMDSERDSGPCLDLVLGYGKERESHQKPFERENYRVPREETNHLKISPSVICGLTGEQNRGGTINAKDSGNPEHIIAEQNDDSCLKSSGDHVNSLWSRRHIHTPSDLINPSPPSPLAIYLPRHWSPLEVTDSDGNNRIPHRKLFIPVTDKRLVEDPMRTHADEFPKNCLGNTDSIFSSQSNSCCSFLPTNASNDKSCDAGIHQILGDRNIGCLCYEPLQEEDLHIFVSTGRFPSTDSYIRVPRSPISIHVPTNHEKVKSVDYSSPEATLRSAAMSYTNTPSIIRKRGPSVCTLEKVTDTSSNKLQLVHKCAYVEDGLLSNAIQLFLSPPKYRKLEKSVAIKSVEKRLEYAFDDAFNSGNANINILAAGDSSGVSHDFDGSLYSSGV